MTKPTPSNAVLASTCSSLAHEVGVADGVAQRRVQLFPMGISFPKNGKPAKLILRDKAHAAEVVASTLSMLGKSDMMVDYDHQAPRAVGVAGTAKAAGWIDPASITVEDDGIYATASWTPEGGQKVADREYRYTSPYFHHRPDGTVTRIINLALTNIPNLDLAAVASAIDGEAGDSQLTEEEENEMDLKAIATALGLPETADEKAVLAAAASAKAKGDALNATASAIGIDLKDDTDLASIATAVGTLKDAKPGDPDPTQFVSMDIVKEMKSEMSALTKRVDEADGKERTAMLDTAVTDGRLTPAMRKHFDANFKDMASLASALGDLPKTNLGQRTTPADPAVKATELTPDEKSVASMMGLSDAEYLETRNADLESA